MRRAFLVHLGLVLALAEAGCRRAGLAVVHDLVEELPAAEISGGPTVVLFGTPAAEAYEQRGFSRADGAEPERFAWAGREAKLSLRWDEVRPRVAALDLSPAPGLRRQTLDLRLNGARVARVPFRHRARFVVELPARLQKAGDNRLSLSFGRASASSGTGPPRAARLHGLAVDAAGASRLAWLAEPDAPPLVEGWRDGEASLVQMSGLSVSYALRLPAAAELRARPRLADGSRSPARLSVAVEEPAGQVQELWSGTLTPGQSVPEVRVGLAGHGGRSARLVLRAEGSGPAWAVWGAPRILAPSPPAARDPRAETLRTALRGRNVVLVVLDAAGARHFSSYGYERRTTPEIDAIAAEGVLFENAYTTGVYTLAAMGSLWTSRAPEESSAPGRGLSGAPGSPLTLAERLAAHGIHSAGFVANARAGKGYGMDRGFSEFHEVLAEGVGRAGALREAVAGWLRQAPPAPFFLYVHFREPHFPYDPPPPFDTRFGPTASVPAQGRRDQVWIDAVNAGRVSLSPDQLEGLTRLYDGNLACADREIGALRRGLEDLGLWDDSVIVITGDHGEALGEHGYIGHNRQVHAESAHVPLVVRFPRGLGPAGVRVAALTGLLDVAPTLAEIFGLADGGRPEDAFSGTSLLPLALGSPGRGFVVTRNAADERATYAIRDGRYTLLRSLRRGRELLFDSVKDPHETRDVARSEPLEAAVARGRLFLWLARLRPEPAPDAGSAPRLTPEQRAQLRALGYVE
jgi:arylsulfatase A-like enzyme